MASLVVYVHECQCTCVNVWSLCKGTRTFQTLLGACSVTMNHLVNKQSARLQHFSTPRNFSLSLRLKRTDTREKVGTMLQVTLPQGTNQRKLTARTASCCRGNSKDYATRTWTSSDSKRSSRRWGERTESPASDQLQKKSDLCTMTVCCVNNSQVTSEEGYYL